MGELMGERLQKVLARAGQGSRREVEALITRGCIQVNGQVAKLGDRVGQNDRVSINRREYRLVSHRAGLDRVIMYNKPAGEVCTRRDPEQRPSVFEPLPRLRHQRWISIGRLDLNSTGLMLFTTDGHLANLLMHPSGQIEREYAVRVFGRLSDAGLRALREGVELEDGPARFESVKSVGGSGANHWYHVVLKEGRNREVRRIWESIGLRVARLTRVRFANLSLPKDLRPGRTRELTAAQKMELLKAIGPGAHPESDEPELALAPVTRTAKKSRPRKRRKFR
jgi:23S rRNA pseudouridine2605 synthase